MGGVDFGGEGGLRLCPSAPSAPQEFLSAVRDAEHRFALPASPAEPGQSGGGGEPPRRGGDGEEGGAEGAAKRPRLGPPHPPLSKWALRPSAAGDRRPPSPAPPSGTGLWGGPGNGVAPHPTPPEPPPGVPPSPVLTNHVVQLVAAASRAPPPAAPRPAAKAKSRRFPGPAGLLPQQQVGKRGGGGRWGWGRVAPPQYSVPSPPGLPAELCTNAFSLLLPPLQHTGKQHLEQILISTPTAPAHGAVAKLRVQVKPFTALWGGGGLHRALFGGARRALQRGTHSSVMGHTAL